MTSAGLDWDREKWRGSVASKFIRGGEKNAVKYADEIIVLSKDVQKYFLETYGRETHFIPNGVNRPEVREAKLITDADYFEGHPIQAAVLVVSYIYANHRESGPYQFDEFLNNVLSFRGWHSEWNGMEQLSYCNNVQRNL